MINTAKRLNFLESNKDWSEFISSISQNTGTIYHEQWIENARANTERVKKYGWAAEALQEAHKGKTAICLGASPAITKQIDRLRELQNEPDFVFIGISSGLKYLFENGIKPKYAMICDADPKVSRFWDGMDMAQTKDITLIANVCVHPSLLDMWQGDMKFLAVWTTIEDLDKELQKHYAPLNGCGAFFPALCSQYNTGVAFAYLILECPIVIFVGNELSFETQKTSYYIDREDIKDSWVRKPHINIFGDTVYTNYMFMSLKFALEDFLGKLPGWFFNATEAGIFGVSVRYGNLAWIHQLKLAMAITQARAIMRTGNPLTIAKKEILH